MYKYTIRTHSMILIMKAIFIIICNDCSIGRGLQRCSNRGSSIGVGSSSNDSGSRVEWSVVSGMSDIKIPQTLAFHVPGQPLRCPTLFVLLITRFCPSSIIPFFFPSVHPSCIRTYPSFLTLFPLRFTARHYFILLWVFSGEYFVPKTKLPTFPISLSSHLPTSFGARARHCLWNQVGITRMPRCVRCIHELYARILNRLPQHSVQEKLLGNSCQERCRL